MNRIVVLSGAGISAESGLQTFRGADGLWEGHRVEEVASPTSTSATAANSAASCGRTSSGSVRWCRPWRRRWIWSLASASYATCRRVERQPLHLKLHQRSRRNYPHPAIDTCGWNVVVVSEPGTRVRAIMGLA
jgi:hypothetical protein